MKTNFTIHAAPIGKARPRVTNHGTYTPKKTREYEALVRSEYNIQCGLQHFGDKPLSVYIEAWFPIPKSTSKAKSQDMLYHRILPTKKPDADNVAKAICDALNGVAWNDDAQIVTLTVIKRYGAGHGNVNVVIREVETE